MKLSAIIDTEFKSAYQKLKNSDVSMAFNFKLEQVVASVDAELAKYETVRAAALKKYGTLKEDGTLLVNEIEGVFHAVFKSEEAAKTFATEHTDLAESEINIVKLKLSDLATEDIKMSQNEYKKLKAALVEGYDKVVGKDETKA